MSHAYGPAQKNQRKNEANTYYEEGELRDKSIEEKFDPNYRREDLLRVIKRAAKKR